MGCNRKLLKKCAALIVQDKRGLFRRRIHRQDKRQMGTMKRKEKREVLGENGRDIHTWVLNHQLP